MPLSRQRAFQAAMARIRRASRRAEVIQRNAEDGVTWHLRHDRPPPDVLHHDALSLSPATRRRLQYVAGRADVEVPT
jgi:hypothetical protein